jgi:hypothetical protein
MLKFRECESLDLNPWISFAQRIMIIDKIFDTSSNIFNSFNNDNVNDFS